MRRLLAVGLLVGCSQKIEPAETGLVVPSDVQPPSPDPDPPTDTDPPTPVPTGALDCTADYPTPPADGSGGLYPECVTQRVFCGETIEATISGGSNLYDYDFWLDNLSLSSLVNKPELVAGTERVYVIEPIFSGGFANITIESCNPVWASWIATGDLTPYCALETQAPMEHFYEEQGRYIQRGEVFNGSIGEYGVQVIVDSEPGFEGNFLMTVECG